MVCVREFPTQDSVCNLFWVRAQHATWKYQRISVCSKCHLKSFTGLSHWKSIWALLGNEATNISSFWDHFPRWQLENLRSKTLAKPIDNSITQYTRAHAMSCLLVLYCAASCFVVCCMWCRGAVLWSQVVWSEALCCLMCGHSRSSITSNNQIVQSECRQSIAKVQSNRAFSFSFSIPLCGLGVCTAAKCCLNLVFKGSVSLRESSDLDGSFLCFYDPWMVRSVYDFVIKSG